MAARARTRGRGPLFNAATAHSPRQAAIRRLNTYRARRDARAQLGGVLDLRGVPRRRVLGGVHARGLRHGDCGGARGVSGQSTAQRGSLEDRCRAWRSCCASRSESAGIGATCAQAAQPGVGGLLARARARATPRLQRLQATPSTVPSKCAAPRPRQRAALPPRQQPAVNTFMGHGAAVASPARAPRDVTPPSKGASRQGTLAAASKGEPGAPEGARLATARRLRAAPLCDPTSHARLTARAASPAG